MKQIGITETYDPCFVSDWEIKSTCRGLQVADKLLYLTRRY